MPGHKQTNGCPRGTCECDDHTCDNGQAGAFPIISTQENSEGWVDAEVAGEP